MPDRRFPAVKARNLQQELALLTADPPFIPDPFRTDLFPRLEEEWGTEQQAQAVDALIPAPASITPPPPQVLPTPVEEQYVISERQAIGTSTTMNWYDIITPEPKQILLIAESNDHFVDFNTPISTNSPKIFASGSLSMTGKGVKRIYIQTVTGTGTLRIVVWSR
jgi:hypothetical protein